VVETLSVTGGSGTDDHHRVTEHTEDSQRTQLFHYARKTAKSQNLVILMVHELKYVGKID